MTAVSGVAVFAGLTMTQAGSYTLSLSNSTVGATTTPLTVKAAPAAHLEVTAQPPVATAAMPRTVARPSPFRDVRRRFVG